MQPFFTRKRPAWHMRRLRNAFLAVAATLVAGSMPAAASCAPPIPIAQALRDSGSIFIGTVVRLANANRTATFEVDEVWVGPDLPAQTVVHGGAETDMFTSVDRTWEANRRYLVFASPVDGQLTDNACSNSQIWSDDLEALRPTDARPPADPNDNGTAGALPLPVLVVIGVLGAIGLVSFLAFRRAH